MSQFASLSNSVTLPNNNKRGSKDQKSLGSTESRKAQREWHLAEAQRASSHLLRIWKSFPISGVEPCLHASIFLCSQMTSFAMKKSCCVDSAAVSFYSLFFVLFFASAHRTSRTTACTRIPMPLIINVKFIFECGIWFILLAEILPQKIFYFKF